MHNNVHSGDQNRQKAQCCIFRLGQKLTQIHNTVHSEDRKWLKMHNMVYSPTPTDPIMSKKNYGAHETCGKLWSLKWECVKYHVANIKVKNKNNLALATETGEVK